MSDEADRLRARVRAAAEGYLRKQAEIAAKAAEPPKPRTEPAPQSEASVLKAVSDRAWKLGANLYRNQVGQYRLPDGRWIRSGLAVGSPDLVGWVSVTVTPEMVGTRLAVFVGVEVKGAAGSLSDAQRAFLGQLDASGAVSGVARSAEDVDRLLAPWISPKTTR